MKSPLITERFAFQHPSITLPTGAPPVTPHDTHQLIESIHALVSPYVRSNPALAALLRGVGTLCNELAAQANSNIPASPLAESPAPIVPSIPAAQPSMGAPPAPVQPEPVQPAPVPAEQPPRAFDPRVRSIKASVPLVLGDSPTNIWVEGSTSDIGRAREAAQYLPAAPREPLPAVPDLALIAQRCALKARSCRLYLRRRGIDESSDEWFGVKQDIDDTLRQAKLLPSCFLWVLWREREQPSDAVVERCAHAYEHLRDAALLAAKVDEAADLNRFRPGVYQSLATAQSALRASLLDTWLTSDDHDQNDAFLWLRSFGAARSVYIARHMRLEDAADPELLPQYAHELGALRAAVAASANATAETRELIGKVRYHARRIGQSPGTADPDEWSALARALALAARAGIRPGNERLDQALAALAGAQPLPPELSAELAPWLPRSSAPDGGPAPDDLDSPDESDPSDRWAGDPDVAQARGLLAGSRLVIIGGERREHAAGRITRAFELTDLDWVSLREHGSSAPLEHAIAKPDTSAVLVLVRLSGHLHLDDARAMCRKHGKPLVTLPAGYGIRQIAAAIIEQASERLSSSEP